MGYYDDWVEPNAFFRGGSSLGSKKNPQTHFADGCGAKVRLVPNLEEVTCRNCIRRLKDLQEQGS